MQFWQPAWKLRCHKSKKFMFQVRKKGTLTKLSKNYFCQRENSVATNPKNLCSKSEKKEHSQNFQKIIFEKLNLNVIFWKQKVQFSILIALPKTFSPSTVNVRSKFWRIWKKRDFSKVWFFVWSYETKTATFNFDIPAETFFAKHGNSSFKILKNWEKKRTFRSLVFWLIFWDEDCNFQFWYPCRKKFGQARWMFVQNPEEFEKNQNFQKLFFFTQSVPLDT